MEFTVRQVAELLRGRVEGDESLPLHTLAKIEEAQAGALAFLSNLKYEPHLYTTQATAVIVNQDFKPRQPVTAALIYVEDAYTSFSTLLEYYQSLALNQRSGAEEPAYLGSGSTFGEQVYRGAFSYIGNGCTLGRNVKIFPHVYIGDKVKIGDNTIIYAGAKIYPDTVIGNNCVIHAGAVIGSDGFGFAPQKDGSYKAIPQIGNVVLEDEVSIGANATIDCATLGSTHIRKGSKIDNLVQIAHNVEVGNHTVIAAQSGISGSTKIGNRVVIAGQVGIVGHLQIADRTTVGAQSGVSKSVQEEGTIIQGSPAFDYKQNLRSMTVFRKLPDLQKQVALLEQKVSTFEQKSEQTES
jgi:UDP-3-O-[3-hydroxymyristoyl] glucosamine N-acyltransferase